MEEIWVVRDGERIGPFAEDEILRGYESGALRGSDVLWAEGLREGQPVEKGDPIGYVGTTGNAPPNTPHLHFTIFKLAPGKRWWEGTPINPYPLWALRR